MHTERLIQSIYVPSLVLIALSVFLLESGQKQDKLTDATERPTHAGVGTSFTNLDVLFLNRWMRTR